MARQSEDSRHSKYVIRIICEGEKTEPLFFTSLCDKLLDENDGMEKWDVKTIPQPDIPEEKPSGADRGLYKNKKKKDKKSDKKNSSKKKKKKKDKSKKADKDYRSKNIAKEEAFDE